MNNVLPYILSWLQEFGYPILWLSIFVGALGIPLPNTLVLLAAGAFAALGDFNIFILLPVAISAFLTGDSSSYWIGRLWGSKVLAWLEKSGRLIKPQTIARSRVYFARLGGWAIFLSRSLVSALGGAINILAGAELYPYRRFLAFDLLGETVGALLPLSLGYIFGASWDAIGDLLGSFSVFILAFLVALVLGYQVFRLVKHMRKLEQAHTKPLAEDPLKVPVVVTPLSEPDPTPSSPGNLPL